MTHTNYFFAFSFNNAPVYYVFAATIENAISDFLGETSYKISDVSFVRVGNAVVKFK